MKEFYNKYRVILKNGLALFKALVIGI